uniref:F-box domain-containing protein n=1 Tax=Panagrolaimus superbus TaxID=310955 RepID=A0A914Y0N7_9BILA
MLTFNTENMAPQYFALPAPTMNYIFKNLQPQHLIKLYQTSKFFYNKFRRNIIQNLEIVDNGEAEVLNPTKSVICVSNPVLSKLADFWITDSFIYRSSWTDEYIAKFTNIYVKKVELCDYIKWEEYEALTKSETIEEIKVKEIFRDDEPVCIEDIISRIPNATSIEISESTFTDTSCATLASLNHKAKLSNIIIRNINTDFNFTFVDGTDNNVFLEKC